MAVMVPDTIPSKASQGEKLLFNTLRDQLSDDFIIWYEPLVNERYPDFIVLGPGFGLLILEVKGWYATQVEQANNNFFNIRWKRGESTQTETEQNPLKQGQGYFGTVADKLKGYPVLCHPDGNYRGKLCFPVGVGAVMSNMTEAQARENDLYVLLRKPAVAYQDELPSWAEESSPELTRRLKSMFKVDFPFAKLTADQISTIKGVLHPEVAIKEVPATQTSLPLEVKAPFPSAATILLSLDAEQERMARTMKGGHRLISGVAGSGKTLILLARAKVLANRLTQHRILLLCFNITLAAQLRSQLHEDTRNPHYRERIEVMHFHEWAGVLMGSLPSSRKFKDIENYNQFIGQEVLAKLQSFPPEERWDSVLVDEAHTFSRSWLQCCVAALKDPADGDLLIVSDGSQSIYKREKFTWKEVGIKAQGRSQILTQNYRNTQEILSAAWGMLQLSQDDDTEPTFPVVKPESALRRGPKPTPHITQSKADAVNVVVKQVSALCEAGYSPADIAILYRRKGHRDPQRGKKEELAFESMLSQLQVLGLCPYWITATQETKRNYSANCNSLQTEKLKPANKAFLNRDYLPIKTP